MAPGPKKKSFHTPRNPKNSQVTKNDKKNNESNTEIDKSVDLNSLPTDPDISSKSKYSKRSVESNWNKYEEPQIDPHADSKRGNDFEVLLSYSGGSGSQHKLQDEKEWEDDALNMKEISMNLKELICSMKYIPFHERIGIQNIFNENQITNFILNSEKWKMSYKPHSELPTVESKDVKISTDSDLGFIEEPDSPELDDYAAVKIVVQDKTENIIDSLTSNLSFDKFAAKVECDEMKVNEIPPEEKCSETASNDLDFLLSLNISSKLSVKEESAPKTTNVDDWLNSILDD